MCGSNRCLGLPNPVREAETPAYLTNTYVEPGHRGAGLGSALVEVAVDWCRKVGVDSWASTRCSSGPRTRAAPCTAGSNPRDAGPEPKVAARHQFRDILAHLTVEGAERVRAVLRDHYRPSTIGADRGDLPPELMACTTLRPANRDVCRRQEELRRIDLESG